MLTRLLRALIVCALPMLLLLTVSLPAAALIEGPPEFTWTLDGAGRARFDACGSNGGTTGRIIEYKWVIFQFVPPSDETKIEEQVLHRTGSSPDLCDAFSYTFPAAGRYRVVLDILHDTGERQWIAHSLEVVLAQADLAVSVTDGADPVVEGHGGVTYTIVLTNNGPDAATGVELGAIVSPAGGADWSLSSDGGMVCGVGSGLSCDAPSLAAGASFQVRVHAALGEPGTLSLSAHARSAVADPDASNDSAVERTTVIVDDQVPPDVVGVPGREPDSNGWYARAVMIDWRATDPDPSSGAPDDPPDTRAETEGRDIEYTSERSCDPAGNCARGSLTLSIDATAPEVTCESPRPTFVLGATDARVRAIVSDTLSGPDDETVVGTADTSDVGERTVALSGRDRAGHETTVSCSYRVAYVFEGFFAPVDGGDVLNVAKAGQAIPLKWRLTDASGAPVVGLATATVTVKGLDCSAGATADQIQEEATGGSGLQDLGDGYYQLNWKTPKSYARSCKTMRLDLGEGVVHTAPFQFTR